MSQVFRDFETFFPGSHLILGDAGSGKSKLIWSILQSKDFSDKQAINIVLTDTEQRIWSAKKASNPVQIITPFDTDISWVTNPCSPGIYYCACEYAPRIITFLECLATWAIQNQENLDHKVRLFIDFSSKYWSRSDFVDQLSRLHYISTNQSNIEIWAVIGSFKKVSPLAQSLFQQISLILTNPFPENWIDDLCLFLALKKESLPGLDMIDFSVKEGFYYIPYKENAAYLKR